MALIAPSLIGADIARLGEALDTIKRAGACMVHIDAADGHFVPDLTVGQPVIARLRKATDLVLDLHLLIERPERYVEEFVHAGAERVSVHVEATTQVLRALRLIQRCGAKAGVALHAATAVEVLGDVMEEADLVTLVTEGEVADDRGMPAWVLDKVRAIAALRRRRGLAFELEVEGGVTPENLEHVVRAGADILVIGSAIFNTVSPLASLSEMVRLAGVGGRVSKV